MGIPRPRGRGLIEAPRARRLRYPPVQFRDRAVAASLKRELVDKFDDFLSEFRDRAVAASLKRYLVFYRKPRPM